MISDISPTVIEALKATSDLFNAHKFWHAHEALEAVWLPAAEPDKTLLQGLIQIAAGCHHISKDNAKGAQKLLTVGLEKIERSKSQAPVASLLDLNAWLPGIHDLLANVTAKRAKSTFLFSPDAYPAFPAILLPSC